jgi:hypothetical protein
MSSHESFSRDVLTILPWIQGSSGRGGFNDYASKAKSSKAPEHSSGKAKLSSSLSGGESTTGSQPDGDSHISPDIELTQVRRRNLLVPRGLISKFKLGKGSTSKRVKDDTSSHQQPSFPPSLSDTSSMMGIGSPSIVISSAHTPSMTTASEVDLFFFSDTGTVASTITTIPAESEVDNDNDDAHQRLGLMLIEEADEAGDDESIYLAYAREDNHGQEEGEDEIDTISEGFEGIFSEMDGGPSIFIEAAGLDSREATNKSASGPETPRASEINFAVHLSPAYAYHPPSVSPHVATIHDDEEDDVDPSLRVMRARYSMARYYRGSPTPSHAGSSRDMGAATPLSTASYCPSSTLAPTSSPTSFASSHIPRANTCPIFQNIKHCRDSLSAAAHEDHPSGPTPEPWASFHLPTRISIHSGIHTNTSVHTPLSLRRERMSGTSLLSATDFAANGDVGEDLPPYTPNDIALEIPATRARPLPSVPEVSAVDRLLNLPSVPLDAPRGPRRPPRLTSGQHQPHHERDSITQLTEMSWPSPPNSPPRHRPLLVEKLHAS